MTRIRLPLSCVVALLFVAPLASAGSVHTLLSQIAFSSTRDDTGVPLLAAEVYLMNPDGTDQRRLTENADGDGFAVLSPDGKKIVFDSNRNRVQGEALNTSDLFLMDTKGNDQTFLTRGSSASWSPDSKDVVFHASASGSGTPIRMDPGSATTDSDLFVATIDDVLAGIEAPVNLTNSAHLIEDDADWSPDGERIVYTRHADSDDPRFSNTAEIYVLSADGTGTPERLTNNVEEERGPAWSPDGERILFSCRVGGGMADFEICVMNADGGGLVQLTNNTVGDLTATWSPDGEQIVFHRPPGVGQLLQLFVMNAELNAGGTYPTAKQLTIPPGTNLFASWGEVRVHEQAKP
jgi:TolB protein